MQKVLDVTVRVTSELSFVDFLTKEEIFHKNPTTNRCIVTEI